MNRENFNTVAIENNKLTAGKIIYTIIYLLIFPVLVLFLSGNWAWIEGWIFCIWFIALRLTTIFYLYRKDPALLAERYKKPGADNQKGWVSMLCMDFF